MYNIFNKYLPKIVLISLVIYLFSRSLAVLNGRPLDGLAVEFKNFSIYFLYSFFIGFSNFFIVELLNKLIPWNIYPKKRVIYGILGAIVVSMLSIFLVRIIIELGIKKNSWNYFIENESINNYIISLLISLVIVLAFYSYYFFKEISKIKIKEHQVTAQTESAKFETLKSQIDPHFLFNSLNVLTSLIGENPKQAEQYTSKLSQVYRYVLEQKDKDLVSLEDELDFAKKYMELLKMRFENAIQYVLPENITISDYKIVPLSLQLILENAVKHNRIDEENIISIEIAISDNYLVINNNIIEKTGSVSGTGFGIKNIIERYQLITDKKVVVKKENNIFSIKIPLLTQKIYKMKPQDYNEESRYIKARKQVDKMKEFYKNLSSYLIVIPLLIYINYRTYWEFKWFFFPMIGWGIGILFHFLDAFGYNFFLGKNWEERKIKELMENDKEKWV